MKSRIFASIKNSYIPTAAIPRILNLRRQPCAGSLLRADVLAPFDPAGGLHARFWLGKGQVGIGAHQEYATVLSPHLYLGERS
jgi:hypothetical protein